MRSFVLGVLLCCIVAAQAAAPVFDATAPPNRTILYSYPGVTFVLEVKIIDDDEAGTPEGTIAVSSSVSEGSSMAQGFNPLVGDPNAAPWISTTPLQRINTTVISTAANTILFHYEVTDLNTADFAMVPNPYRELCIQAQDGGDYPPEGWQTRCYRIFILSGPRYDQGCPYVPIQVC
eukprot:1712369-Rhodomonas_salina.1